MLTNRGATLSLFISLLLLAGSQLLVKWRFGVLGLDKDPARASPELLGKVLSDPGLWCAGILVVAGASAWYVALTRLPLALMLPIAGVLSPLIVIGAHLLLGERLTLYQMFAILVIALGVAALSYSQ